MEFLASPRNLPASPQVGSVSNSGEKAPLRALVFRVPAHHLLDGFGYQAGHGPVFGGRVHLELAQQGLGQAQGDVLMTFHGFQCIAGIRGCLWGRAFSLPPGFARRRTSFITVEARRLKAGGRLRA